MQYLLDTNVYRNLVKQKDFYEFQNEIKNLKSLSKNTKVKFLFSSSVCIELLNHLSLSDNYKDECFKALSYKVRLCSNLINGRLKGTIVPEFNELLSLYFFKKSSTYFNLNNNLLTLSCEISLVNDVKNILQHQDEIGQIINFKKTELQNILQNIENHYLKDFSETKDWSIFKNNVTLKNDFKSLIKEKVFHKLFSLSLIKMTFDKDLESKFDLSIDEFLKFNSDFCLSLDFFIENIWRKFIDIEKIEYFSNPESDPKKRWNSFYDTQIIMACEFENCKGRLTKLVTTEKKILLHFKKHKSEEWCISYEDFKKEIIN